MRITKLTAIIGSLLMATLFPLTAMAGQPDVTEEKPADAPTVMVNKKKQGQWFKDMANESDVQYVFIGRPRGAQSFLSEEEINLAADSEISLIEIVSSETSSKGRQTIQWFAERLMTIHPLEIVFQTREEDDCSLVTISVVTTPDNPDIATDILIYNWSKTFEVALIHLNGKFNISETVWGK